MHSAVSHDLLAIKVTVLMGSGSVIKHSPMAEAQVWTPFYLGEGCKLSESVCLSTMPSKVRLLQFSYILLQQKLNISSELEIKRKELT